MKAISILFAAIFAIGITSALAVGPRTRPPYLRGIPPADYQYRDRSASAMLLSELAISSGTLDTGALIALSTESMASAAQPVVPSVMVSPPQLAGAPAPTAFLLTKPCFPRLHPPTAIPIIPLTSQRPNFVIITPPTASSSRLTSPPVAKQKNFQFSKSLVIDHCAVSALSLTMSNSGVWNLSLRADQNPAKEDTSAPTITPSSLQTTQLLRNQFHVEFRCYNTNGIPVDQVASTGIGKPIVSVLPPQDFWVQRAEPLIVRKSGALQELAIHFQEIDRVEVEFYYYK